MKDYKCSGPRLCGYRADLVAEVMATKKDSLNDTKSGAMYPQLFPEKDGH